MAKKVTRSDVAKLAGVSDATVSYVVNNGPRAVAAETRQKVLAAIEELGYRPDAIARSLRRGSTQTIGLLVQNLDSFASHLVNAVEKFLDLEGYRLLLASTHEDSGREKDMLNVLASQAIDGLLFVPSSNKHSDFVQRLIESGMPLVFIDRQIEGVQADAVMTDNVTAAREMTSHLIRSGCRRIMCISFSSTASSALDRVEGYRQALESFGLEFDEELVVLFRFAAGEAWNEVLLDRFRNHNRPDGVLCTTDSQLIQITRALKSAGIRVPEDVLVAGGFFESPWNDLLRYPFPLVKQNYRRIAETAVNFLLRRINGDTNPPQTRLIAPDYSFPDIQPH